jgi:hypothetical protein
MPVFRLVLPGKDRDGAAALRRQDTAELPASRSLSFCRAYKKRKPKRVVWSLMGADSAAALVLPECNPAKF